MPITVKIRFYSTPVGNHIEATVHNKTDYRSFATWASNPDGSPPTKQLTLSFDADYDNIRERYKTATPCCPTPCMNNCADSVAQLLNLLALEEHEKYIESSCSLKRWVCCLPAAVLKGIVCSTAYSLCLCCCLEEKHLCCSPCVIPPGINAPSDVFDYAEKLASSKSTDDSNLLPSEYQSSSSVIVTKGIFRPESAKQPQGAAMGASFQ